MFNSKSTVLTIAALALLELVCSNNVRIPSVSKSTGRKGDSQAQQQSGVAEGMQVEEGFTVGDIAVQNQMQQGVAPGDLKQSQEQRQGDKHQTQQQEGGYMGSQMEASVTYKNETTLQMQDQRMFNKDQLEELEKMGTEIKPPFAL